jgi:redox-sensitive bicupin YhaK (pirin superfamily)
MKLNVCTFAVHTYIIKMKRIDFLKKGILGAGALGIAGLIKSEEKIGSLTIEQVGFNHLPLEKSTFMNNTIIHRANTRGHANHGWLNTHHTFSFAQYYNPERMNFGVLRVLNDDSVAGGQGFGTHPHDNMEIISIPLSGDLEHKDSMGNVQVIRENDVQVLSAGSGITHSEYNRNPDKQVQFLQIWVFPNKRNVKPRYDQLSFPKADRHNQLQQILSPNADDAGVWIHQDAWFHLGSFDSSFSSSYTLKKPGNGIYLFVLEGSIQLDNTILKRRDGMGVWDTQSIQFQSLEKTEILVMEVPMQLA